MFEWRSKHTIYNANLTEISETLKEKKIATAISSTKEIRSDMN